MLYCKCRSETGRERRREETILRCFTDTVPNDHKSERYMHDYEHTDTHKPCDLSISAVVTPSHSLWLFDHNLPPTPGLQSNRNFQEIMLAWHEITDDLCWNNLDIQFLCSVEMFSWQNKNKSLRAYVDIFTSVDIQRLRLMVFKT